MTTSQLSEPLLDESQALPDDMVVFGYLDEHDYQEYRGCLDRIHTFRDEWDFLDHFSKKLKGKCLPYHDEASLWKIQETSRSLAREPNIEAAVEVLRSFVVSTGWEYSVSARREGRRLQKGRREAVEDALDDIVEFCSMGNQTGWFSVLDETYLRFLRDGEFFRRWWVRPDGSVEIRFVEPCDIRQPKDSRFVEGPIPDWIGMELERGVIPGEYGIVSSPNDAALTVGFWYDTGRKDSTDTSEIFEFIPAGRMQHGKDGVDSNDPRGVPAFYSTACLVNLINEVVEAMATLAVKQSRYAVVHKHQVAARREAIMDAVARRVRDHNEQVSNGRRQEEHHHKNVELEMHGLKVQTRNYIEVIQQLQRLVGNVRQIPEYMITGDANTGNRSSLQSATSPFGRRVARDQKRMWNFDRQLKWRAIGEVLGWAPETMFSTRRALVIMPSLPIADSTDRHKDASMVIDLMTAEENRPAIISPQEGARRLGVNYQQMKDERQEAGVPLVAPPRNNNAGNQSSSGGASNGNGANQNPQRGNRPQ